jgi:hypothetical protein
MGTRPERRFRRFDLQYPVHVKFSSGDSTAEVDVVSRNICHYGLLVESMLPIPHHSLVEFTITLTGLPIRLEGIGEVVGGLPIRLEGRGEVVRVEEGSATERFRIAVACAEPIHEIQRITPIG